MASKDFSDIVLAQFKDLELLTDDRIGDVLKILKQSQKELRLRLDALPHGKFSAAHFSQAKEQVDLYVDLLTQRLNHTLMAGGDLMLERAVQNMVKNLSWAQEHFTGIEIPVPVGRALDLVERARSIGAAQSWAEVEVELAARVATNENLQTLLIHRYESSFESLGADLTKRIGLELATGLSSEEMTGDLYRRIAGSLREYQGIETESGEFIGESILEENRWAVRAETITRQELSASYNYGQLEAMKDAKEELFPDLQRRWYSENDSTRPCTSGVCPRLNGQIVDLDEPFEDPQDGETYQNPPDPHPNCMCEELPWRSDWTGDESDIWPSDEHD